MSTQIVPGEPGDAQEGLYSGPRDFGGRTGAGRVHGALHVEPCDALSVTPLRCLSPKDECIRT
jgi:hypothetical protein